MAADTPTHVLRQRKRALLRLAFGSLQITGASAGLYLLLQTGASVPTGVVVGLTMLVAILSRLLFASKGRECEPARQRTRAEEI